MEDNTKLKLRSTKPKSGSEGGLVLTAPRKGFNFFRKKTTKLLLLGGGARVPFMALYQVCDLL